MSFFAKLFGAKGAEPADDEPFMEHPTGEFDTALHAMSSAFRRLKSRDQTDRWITFSAQGRGHDDDSDQIEDVPVRGHAFDLQGQELDVPAILQFAGLSAQFTVETGPQGMVALPGASPEQMAKFLDAVFRKHFGIRPHDDEDDYAVGAEW